MMQEISFHVILKVGDDLGEVYGIISSVLEVGNQSENFSSCSGSTQSKCVPERLKRGKEYFDLCSTASW
jgi:hypothetical protein